MKDTVFRSGGEFRLKIVESVCLKVGDGFGPSWKKIGGNGRTQSHEKQGQRKIWEGWEEARDDKVDE